MAFSLSRPPRVAIIVLNYRGKECLLPCLESLDRLSYPAKDIIVVDNASGDGSWEAAKKKFPWFTYARLSENRGFAGGMNHGLRLAQKRKAEYFWLFNYDAQAEEQSLERLVRIGEREERAGLLSPVIRHSQSGAIWFAAGRVNYWRMRVEHRPAARELLRRPSYPSEILTGCALLIKKPVLEKIGFLDEAFFLYYEDADYSLRACQAGFQARVVPQACVWHEERSQLSDQKIYFLVYSGLLFFARHASPAWRVYLAFYVTIRRIKNAWDRLRGRKQAALVARAYKDYFHSSRTFFGLGLKKENSEQH